MIKFEKDALKTLQALEKEGFETYAAGECVRESLQGEKVYDWDLITRAGMEDLQKLFPQGKVIGKNRQTLRVDYTYEVPATDTEEAYIDGIIVDIKHFDGEAKDELAKRIFTIDALADNPERGFLDPFGGKNDMKQKLIQTVSDPAELFQKNPEAMLATVRLAAETGFDLHKSVYEGTRHWKLLSDEIEKGRTKKVREELERLMAAEYTGKGLKMLAGTGLMAAVWGEDIAGRMSTQDTRSFNIVCENIDKTKRVADRRLGILYTILPKKKALRAIERMQFDETTKQHLIDGVEKIIDINFLNTDMEFKRFLHEMGRDRYMYLHNLALAARIIYDQPTTKSESRNYMLKKIASGREPVFAEDLVIDANDLMEAGIADTPEKAEEVLNLVVALVHKNPVNNHRETLLKYAEKYAKSKFAAKMRYVKWVK